MKKKIATKNAFYAQSGGVTAVINASACGLIETAKQHKTKISKVYAGKNGMLGALNENLIDTSLESDKEIAALLYTPGGAFGSARYKLKGFEENREQIQDVLKALKRIILVNFFSTVAGAIWERG